MFAERSQSKVLQDQFLIKVQDFYQISVWLLILWETSPTVYNRTFLFVNELIFYILFALSWKDWTHKTVGQIPNITLYKQDNAHLKL